VDVYRQEYKSRRNWNSFDVQKIGDHHRGSCASTLREPVLIDSKIDKSGFQQWRGYSIFVVARWKRPHRKRTAPTPAEGKLVLIA
jgi:hypothetical protein